MRSAVPTATMCKVKVKRSLVHSLRLSYRLAVVRAAASCSRSQVTWIKVSQHMRVKITSHIGAHAMTVERWVISLYRGKAAERAQSHRFASIHTTIHTAWAVSFFSVRK